MLDQEEEEGVINKLEVNHVLSKIWAKVLPSDKPLAHDIALLLTTTHKLTVKNIVYDERV